MEEKRVASRIYTISTRLEMRGELKTYLEDYIGAVSHVRRVVLQDFKKETVKKDFQGKSSFYYTYLREQTGLYTVTINSIYRNVKGAVNAYYALKKTEMSQCGTRINSLKRKIEHLEAAINDMKPRVAANEATKAQLQSYRNNKTALYHARNKLNELNFRIENLKAGFKDKSKMSIACGSKAMFKKQYNLEANGYANHEEWYADYVKARDSYIPFGGSAACQYGNFMLQMIPQDNGKFTMRLRKDLPWQKEGEDVFITIPDVEFKYLTDWFRESILDPKKPISYQIVRRMDKWYLYASFRYDTEVVTNTNNGVVACDYRDGFIEVVGVDPQGDISDARHITLEHHGTGNKAKTESQRRISELIRSCASDGRDLIIEDLDLQKSKAKGLKGAPRDKRTKTVNRITHSFDYSRYKELCMNLGIKYGVNVIMVDPKDTSVLGEELSSELKINKYQATALVVGRRGLGLI